MFGWLFQSKSDRILSSTDTEDADILYAGQVDTPTRRKTINQLDKDGFKVTDLSAGEIDKLQDQSVFYRHKMFTAGMNEEEQKKTVADLKRIENETETGFIQDPYVSWYHKDKNRTADYLEQQFSEYENVRMTQEFNDEEAFEIIEENAVVAKPSRNCCGNGVRKLQEESNLESYIEELENDSYRLEEAIDHEDVKDCRAIVLGDGEDATVLEIAARENGAGFANNLSNGGNYTDSGEIFDYEIDAALDATEGLEVAAFDYMKTSEGEIVGLEVNSDMGTAINEEYSTEIDINEEIADYIHYRTKDNFEYDSLDQDYASHLEVTQTNKSGKKPSTGMEGSMNQKAAPV
ncbi:MAG: hypothetical protein ACI977_000060 [Candidatus Nanohaloarchaea archaeon]|jgi:hypothetical protein